MQDNFISLKKKKLEIYTSYIITLYNETLFSQLNEYTLCVYGDKNLKHIHTQRQNFLLFFNMESLSPNDWLCCTRGKKPFRWSSLSCPKSAVLRQRNSLTNFKHEALLLKVSIAYINQFWGWKRAPNTASKYLFNSVLKYVAHYCLSIQVQNPFSVWWITSSQSTFTSAT